MVNLINKFYFIILFALSSTLVLLSRKFQVNYVIKNTDEFFFYGDPIFTNPDAYFFLNNIKEQLISESSFTQKIISNDFLTSIFVCLYYVFNELNLPLLVLYSSPWFTLISFFCVFLFFKSITDKYIALLVGFAFVLSNIVITRSSALFFDTDIINISFFFLILFFIKKFSDNNLNRKEFYINSSIIFFLNFLFIFHYSQEIFSLIFLIMILIIFWRTNQKFIDKTLVLIVFTLFIFISFNGIEYFFNSLIEKYSGYTSSQNRYSNSEYINDTVITVGELKRYTLFEIEKFLFSMSFYGIAIFSSIVGLIIYNVKYKSRAYLFLPFIIFSYLTFKFGVRFIIYIIPFFYFGFIFFIYSFLIFLKAKLNLNKNLLGKFIIFISIIFTWNLSIASCKELFTTQCEQKFQLEPYFNKEILLGILKFNNIKDDYNIISSLDYGYLINYYSKSSFTITPGYALNNQKYKIFFSKNGFTNKSLNEMYEIPLENDNYIFLTKDFIDWWPTINDLYNLEEKKSQILEFKCLNNDIERLNCVTQNGLKSIFDLKNGKVDNKELIYRIIYNDKSNSVQKIVNNEGLISVVYSPELKIPNIFIYFPRRYDDINFINYFFISHNKDNIELIDSNWPYYRTYKVLN